MQDHKIKCKKLKPQVYDRKSSLKAVMLKEIYPWD